MSDDGGRGVPPTLQELESQAIYEALRRNSWHKMAAARELGINKTTLWRKVKRLGITIPV